MIQRLQEAQTKSFQNRKNLLNELTKEKKNFEKNSEISLKQDDLVQFFTNNGELRTLNEENLEEIEKDTKIIDKKGKVTTDVDATVLNIDTNFYLSSKS